MSTPEPVRSPQAPPKALMRLALLGSALLVLLGGGAFYLASQTSNRNGPAAPEISLTVTSTQCQPNELTVSAGLVRFNIANQSDRALEWEILDGVMVVAERENIAPGLTASLLPRLSPGTYAITCGLLSNPRGTLTVTANGDAQAAGPDLIAFIGPLAEMQVTLRQDAVDLAGAANALARAIEAGDLPAAQAAYRVVSAAYRRVEPAARRFADLGSAINATATYFAKREADPQFSGLHRIEYGLFQTGSTAGLEPVASKLLADIDMLGQRFATLKPTPGLLAGNAADYLSSLSETTIPTGEEFYAGNDLGNFSAALDGVEKNIALLRPLSANTAGAESAAMDTALADARQALERLAANNSYPDYRTVSAADRSALAETFGALAGSLRSLNNRIGLGEAQA